MRDAASSGPGILVLGLAEWSAPIATNQHYVTRELAADFDVIFAEGTGTRGPRLNVDDMRRIWRRLTAAPTAQVERPLPPRVTRLPLRLAPHTWNLTAVNAAWLQRQVQEWTVGSGPRVLWTYTPYTYGLEQHADVVVYHVVDQLHELDGVDAAGFLAAQRRLAAGTDVAIATSPHIAEHLSQQGFRTVSTRGNVADTQVFLDASEDRSPRCPGVVFAGALSAQKLDVQLIEGLLDALPYGVPLTLVGPVGSHARDRELVRRLTAAGAVVLPPESREELAKRLSAATVGIVPYVVTAATKGISPLKTYEYLACGIPVVSTALPSLRDVDRAIYVEGAAADFTSRVLDLLQADVLDHSEERRALARMNDWGGRGEELRSLVRALSQHPVPVQSAPGRQRTAAWADVLQGTPGRVH